MIPGPRRQYLVADLFPDVAGRIYSLAMSPVAQEALIGFEDGTLVYWDVTNEEEIHRLEGHKGTVRTLDFSPDGQTALSGSSDHNVILWDLATGEEIRRMEGHDGWVRTVDFSPDGTTAVSGGFVGDAYSVVGNPGQLIKAGKSIKEYHLLEPLLPEVDVFFTSCDEAKLIENTLALPRTWENFTEHENNLHFIQFLTERFWRKDNRTRLFGVTVSNGAYEKHISPENNIGGPNKIESQFMAGEVVDLVGAGDSFRAGLITYIAHNLNQFRNGSIDFAEAVQMGNLFASLFIKASLEDRYGNIKAYDKMLKVVRSDTAYSNFEALRDALN